MRISRLLGVRGRLALVVVAALAGVLAIVAITLPLLVRRSALDQMARELEVVGRMVAHGTTAALVFDDRAGAAERLREAQEVTGVAYLVLEDRNGGLFAATGRAIAERAGYHRLDPGSGPPNDGFLRRSVPVLHAGSRIGTVFVGGQTEPVEQRIDDLLRQVWAGGALLFLVAASATLAWSSRIIRPLTAMAETARAIVRGDWSRRAPPARRHDEIGQLSVAMNHMLDRLRDSRLELERLNHELEARVTERTAQLEDEIAEHRASEVALTRANERFRLAASAVNGAIYEYDLALGTVTWAESFTRVFGYPVDEDTSRVEWWLERIEPSDRERVTAELEACVAAGRDFVGEYGFRRADGAACRVLDRGRVVVGADGRVERMVGSMEDVTELRRYEEKMRDAMRMESIGRLAGGIAHDFNNVLTTILGYCDLLLEESPSPDLQEIQAAARRAASLTQQLLAFSRKQPVQPVTLDVSAVTRELAPMLRRLLGEDVVLAIDCVGEPLSVHIDRAQLEQVIVNVAANARDAMPSGGTLTIRTRATSQVGSGEAGARGWVTLEFADTGVGMVADVLQHAFEPFFTTKDLSEGAGLGLSIVYGVVTQNGGSVQLESEPDRGTLLRIALPRVDVAEAEPARGLVSAPGHERVLVVEDETALRLMLRNLLRARGYLVIEACDGEDALERVDGLEIDVVITDVVMPKLSGPETVQRLRATRPDLPVIYMSGYTEDRLLRDGELGGASVFLAKPFPLASLLEQLRRMLDRSVAAREGEEEALPPRGR